MRLPSFDLSILFSFLFELCGFLPLKLPLSVNCLHNVWGKNKSLVLILNFFSLFPLYFTFQNRNSVKTCDLLEKSFWAESIRKTQEASQTAASSTVTKDTSLHEHPRLLEERFWLCFLIKSFYKSNNLSVIKQSCSHSKHSMISVTFSLQLSHELLQTKTSYLSEQTRNH